jgi:DNA-binding transcriptional LysR family regulator
MRIDLYSLKLFIAVMEEKSLARAAEREHIAASAISKRISELEAVFNMRLFERKPTRLEPLPGAYVLLRHARTVRQNIEQLQIEMSDLSEGVKGTVRVAASIAVITQYLPQQLRTFTSRHPGIEIELTDSLSPRAISLVIEGRADIGIYADPFVAAGLRTLPYCEELLVAVLPAGHDLLARRSLKLGDMLPYDFVCLRQESSLNTLITQAAARIGQPVRRRVQVSGNESVCCMIQVGMGIGILPQAWLESHPGFADISARPLDEPWARRRVQLCYQDHHQTLHMPTQLLLQHLRRA